MGFDISKITNQELKALAYSLDGKFDDKFDGKLSEEEFGVFRQAALEKRKAGECTAEDFNAVMDLYYKEVNGEEAENKTDKKDKTSRNDGGAKKAFMGALEEFVNGQGTIKTDTGIRKAGIVDESGEIVDIVEYMKKFFGEEKMKEERYKDLIKALEDVLAIVPEYKNYTDMTYQAHQDIIKELKEKNINDKLHRDMVKLIEIQREEVIKQNTFKEILHLYAEKARKYNEEEIHKTDEELIKELRKDIRTGEAVIGGKSLKEIYDKKGGISYDGSYVSYKSQYEETLKAFENDMMMTTARKKVLEAIVAQEDETDWKNLRADVKRALKEDEDTDKYTMKAYREKLDGKSIVKEGSQIQAVLNDINANRIQTKEAVLEALGNKRELLELLTAGDEPLIKEIEEDGVIKYDISKLQDLMISKVGYDYTLSSNTSEYDPISEKKGIDSEAEFIHLFGTMTKSDRKRICDLCHIPVETNIDTKKVLAAIPVVGILSGLIDWASSGLNPIKINVDNSKYLDITINNIDPDSIEITGLEDAKGLVEVIRGEKDVRIILDDPQVIKDLIGSTNYVATRAITAGLLGAAWGLAGALLAGKNEVPVEALEFDAENIDEYLMGVKERSPKYAKLLSMIALSFMKSEDDWDREGYRAFLKDAAGNDGLNRREALGALMKRANKIKTANIELPPEFSVEITSEQKVISETKRRTLIHTRTYKDTWKGLVDAYYPELVEKCGDYWGPEGAIRALKKALSYEYDAEGNMSFNEDTYNKLIMGGNLPEIIKLPLEIEGIKRNDDGEVQAGKISGEGRALINEVGLEYSDEIIEKPGDTIYTATDTTPDDNKNGTSATGATEEEAIQKLQEQTGRKYKPENINYES